MRKIANKFWVMGTNSEWYFQNYLKHINVLGILESVEVDGSKLKIQEHTIDYGSTSTIRQNINAWEGMGFIYAVSRNEFIKLIPEYTERDLIDIVFYSLFKPSNNKIVCKFRDTILIKLNSIIKPNEFLITKYSLSKTRGNLKEEEIKNEIGKFEKRIIANNEYREIIKVIIREDM